MTAAASGTGIETFGAGFQSRSRPLEPGPILAGRLRDGHGS